MRFLDWLLPPPQARAFRDAPPEYAAQPGSPFQYRLECRDAGESYGARLHAAITDALDLSNGNLRAVQRFSRHRDPRMLAVYDDNREDLGGRIAALVAEAAA